MNESNVLAFSDDIEVTTLVQTYYKYYKESIQFSKIGVNDGNESRSKLGILRAYIDLFARLMTWTYRDYPDA